MLNAPPYLAVVGLVAVVAGLAGLDRLCRQSDHHHGAPQRSPVRLVALVVQALLLPAARAVLAVTGIWLVMMVVTGAVQMRGAAGEVAQPVAVGIAAGLILMTVPQLVAAIGESACASMTRYQDSALCHANDDDFMRWEAELRTGPPIVGPGETHDSPS